MYEWSVRIHEVFESSSVYFFNGAGTVIVYKGFPMPEVEKNVRCVYIVRYII